jgi:hypothetical protein
MSNLRDMVKPALAVVAALALAQISQRCLTHEENSR